MRCIYGLLLFKRLNKALCFTALLAVGCAANVGLTPTSVLKFPSWNLLIDGGPFPRYWEVDPCGPTDRTCFGETHALRVFGIVNVPGHVIQDVFRLDSIRAAQDQFQTVREVDFRPRQPPNVQFSPPREIPYHSLIADEYYLGCGVDRISACRAIFRYGNYFIYFYMDVDDGKGYGLKIEQVEPILRAMDEKASSVLGIPLPKKP